jgi:hypothetical protein
MRIIIVHIYNVERTRLHHDRIPEVEYSGIPVFLSL